ncbi:MAG TPA: HAMP domain-containing protein, partial [Candidatus Margulisiibacteriota bacterium]|nr:HAMP domain-containing protein [Candidatus Margulisiibacteriota bacterium]
MPATNYKVLSGLTLQNRITTLMIISSVLFISVFTFIQLNIQLNSIDRYNSYQANLSSIIVKNNIQAIINKAEGSDSNLTAYIHSSLQALNNSGIIKEAVVYDKGGKIIAATEEKLLDTTVNYRDLDKINELEYISQNNRWFLPATDRIHNRLYIYIAIKLKTQEPIAYIAKVAFALGNVQEALFQVYKPVIITTIITVVLNIIFGYLFSRTIIGPIKILNEVTKIIAGGNLAIRTKIRTNDEIQELGETFNYMTEELIKMK